jgi:hypothetical protein
MQDAVAGPCGVAVRQPQNPRAGQAHSQRFAPLHHAIYEPRRLFPQDPGEQVRLTKLAAVGVCVGFEGKKKARQGQDGNVLGVWLGWLEGKGEWWASQ